jgi:branched-chain amino acid transport system permease protein
MALPEILRAPVRPDEGAGGFIIGRHRVRAVEALPWILALAAYFVLPGYLHLGAQVLIMVLFALSLDLILGYAGIITLGHAALYGAGAYTAGILAARLGWSEPITGLMAAAAVAGAVGFLSGWFLLRTRGLTLLMLTLSVAILLQEFANEQESLTGGADGLTGIKLAPLFGAFRFDLTPWRSCSCCSGWHARSSTRRSARRCAASARTCGGCTPSEPPSTASW